MNRIKNKIIQTFKTLIFKYLYISSDDSFDFFLLIHNLFSVLKIIQNMKKTH